MRKSIMTGIAFLFIAGIYGQSNNYEINYDKGTQSANAGKYQEAISFYSLSIEEHPTSDAYYNRAAVFYELGDSCNFCNDLSKAMKMNDSEAKKMYHEKCAYTRMSLNIPDSIKLKYPEISHFEIIHYFCNDDSVVNMISKTNNIIYEDDVKKYANEDVFIIVETMPEFKVGSDALSHYLKENIFYPIEAAKKGISGTVYVSFIVEPNGSVSNVKLLKGIGGGCDEEALRVVKLMPKWKPGIQSGKNVRVMFNLPVSFQNQRKTSY
jgi:TonB family protein